MCLHRDSSLGPRLAPSYTEVLLLWKRDDHTDVPPMCVPISTGKICVVGKVLVWR